MSFNDRFRQVIGTSTIDEFAQAVDEPAQRIKDVLRGKQRPPSDLLLKLVLRLGVDLNWLLAGDQKSLNGVPEFSVREISLIENYRAAAEDGRRALEQASAALAKSSKVETQKKAA